MSKSSNSFVFSFIPKSESQKQAIKCFNENDLSIFLGPAGSGKSFTALSLALQEVHLGRKKKVIFTRPLVEAGEKLGYLPGELDEKIAPYAQVMEYLKHQIVYKLPEGILEFVPLAYMRGMTYTDTVMILSESQNCRYTQLRMFCTRAGKNSKIILEGDEEQSDLPTNGDELLDFTEALEGNNGIGVIDFQGNVDFRSPIVRTVLRYT